MTVRTERHDGVLTVIIARPAQRNAVDGPTAAALADAFRLLDRDDALHAAVLWGEGGHFCAGADLTAVARDPARANRLVPDGDGPMGPTRITTTKPVLAAVEGYAVAGGLELACWCDLRVAAEDAVFGVFCRRFGVPLIDGGTVRLPRLIGESHALDMILTGRPVGAPEAARMGLVNRLVPPGQARAAAEALAADLGRFPRRCLLGDRLGVREQWDLSLDEALAREFHRGMAVIESGETGAGAEAFAAGKGRGGQF